jgi:hypothetical protein
MQIDSDISVVNADHISQNLPPLIKDLSNTTFTLGGSKGGVWTGSAHLNTPTSLRPA